MYFYQILVEALLKKKPIFGFYSECTFFLKQWVYKHTKPQITDYSSILLSIFPASDLPMGKFLLHNFVYFVSEIELSSDVFLSFVSGLLQTLEELFKDRNLRIVCLYQYQNH